LELAVVTIDERIAASVENGCLRGCDVMRNLLIESLAPDNVVVHVVDIRNGHVRELREDHLLPRLEIEGISLGCPQRGDAQENDDLAVLIAYVLDQIAVSVM
jgi:hypothetical protein